MYKRNIILMFVMSLLCVGMVSALTFERATMIYFPFNESLGEEYFYDSLGRYAMKASVPLEMVSEQNIDNFSTNMLIFNHTEDGKINMSINESIGGLEVVLDNFITGYGGVTDFEICTMVKIVADDNLDVRTIIDFFGSYGEGDDDSGISLVYSASDNVLRYSMYDGADLPSINSISDPSQDVYSVCINKNATHYNLYLNGTMENNHADSDYPLHPGMFVLGLNDRVTDREFEGNMSYILFVNRTLSSVERNSLIGLGMAGEATPPAPTFNQINLSIPEPSNNPLLNTFNHQFNITANATTDFTDSNFSLYINGVLNNSKLVINANDMNVNFTINFISNNNHTYFWNATVFNLDGTQNDSQQTSQYAFEIDTTNPVITLKPNNGFNINNLTVISNYLRNLTLNISFFDYNLFQTLINITNSTGDSVFQNLTSISGTTFNFSDFVPLNNLSLGNYTIKLLASDSHTISEWGEDVIEKVGIKYLEFETSEENTVRITSNTIPISKGTISLKDRKSFYFNYLFIQDYFVYTLTSDNKITYLENSEITNSPHFVIVGDNLRGNWIDFEEFGLNENDFSVKKISDYEYDIIIKSNGVKSFSFNSIGGLNVIEDHYQFAVGSVVNVSAFNPLTGRFLNFTSTLDGIIKNSTFQTSSSVQYENVTVGSKLLTVSSPGFDLYSESFNVTGMNHSIVLDMYNSNVIDNCGNYSNILLTFWGKNEETDANVSMDLDLTIWHTATANSSFTINTSFIFTGQTNYSICTNYNQTFSLDAIMEYGGDEFAEKKYYLNNYTANSSIVNEVNLYHLNISKGSEITFTVFDKLTGDSVDGVFIKILRYYPGENIYKTVEVVKTDEQGKSLGKMVLADVFYKFILEKPAGTVKLNTDVLRILSLTRSFGISFAEDVLDTWDKIHGVSISTTCTKGTQTCRTTWSDGSNIIQDVTMEVWRINGLTNSKIFTNTVASSSGSIVYTIVEETDGNRYEARSYIESNTGTSNYLADIATLLFSDNPFFTDSEQRLASLFPLFLLVVVLIFALIDFSAVGVTIGALVGLVLGSILGILPLSPFYFISFILMGGILIYKIKR